MAEVRRIVALPLCSCFASRIVTVHTISDAARREVIRQATMRTSSAAARREVIRQATIRSGVLWVAVIRADCRRVCVDVYYVSESMHCHNRRFHAVQGSASVALGKNLVAPCMRKAAKSCTFAVAVLTARAPQLQSRDRKS